MSSELTNSKGTPDSNGNTCEIVPPAGDICSPGAAGTIESPGALVGASTVSEVVSCTSSVVSSSTVVSTTTTATSI